MAVKDVSVSANAEHKNPVVEEPDRPVAKEDKSDSSQIKNAHAVGDGSYGRNDESLPDENEGASKVEKDSSNY